MNAHQRRLRRRSAARERASHDAWLDAMARECRCCWECCCRPCDGLAAGGLCDRLCSCAAQYDDDAFGDYEDQEDA